MKHRSYLCVCILLGSILAVGITGDEMKTLYEFALPDYLTMPEDKADEMTNAMIQTYSAATSDLIRQLYKRDMSNMAKVRIIYMLGELRVLAATSVLIDNINLDAERMDPKTRIARWGRYPAHEALVKIGPYASRMIMSIIGSPKYDEAKLDGYAVVLAEIESPQYALMKLQDCLNEAKGEILQGQYEAVIAQIKSISSEVKTASRKSVTESLINTSNPKTWEAAITGAQDHIREISAALITVAKDEKRSNDDRRKAIFLLGKIENKESLNFLIENIALYVQMGEITGDDDTLKETPCAYALWSTRSWKVAQAVFASLEIPKSKRERIHFAGVLESTLGKNLVLAAIEEHLHRTPRPITAQRRGNLDAIREYLH